ncbi:MAG: class I SAM-dependent methyltransferase [Phycisphaeraceae bacterium]
MLDLGCGSGIHAVALARRGWQVTGIDCVPKALRRARHRAKEAGVQADFVRGDVTALRDIDVGSDFRLILDFGTLHGLPQAQRVAVGRTEDRVATVDTVSLTLAFAPPANPASLVPRAAVGGGGRRGAASAHLARCTRISMERSRESLHLVSRQSCIRQASC